MHASSLMVDYVYIIVLLKTGYLVQYLLSFGYRYVFNATSIRLFLNTYFDKCLEIIAIFNDFKKYNGDRFSTISIMFSVESRKTVYFEKLEHSENRSVRFFKPEHSIFTVIRWSIFLNEDQLCIFHKLDIHACFSGYTPISQTIWLNFTQEIK
jgi:hypothetical protein